MATPRSFPETITDIAGAPPVFYATIAGKIHVSTDGGATWNDSALPGFQGEAGAIAASPDHPEIAYVSYNGLRAPVRSTWGVAKTTDSGRHWEAGLRYRARRLADRTLRRRMGRRTHRSRRGAA